MVLCVQNGTFEEDEFSAAAVGDDDSVVFAGHSYGNWSGTHAGNRAADFAATKLDPDGKELWR